MGNNATTAPSVPLTLRERMNSYIQAVEEKRPLSYILTLLKEGQAAIPEIKYPLQENEFLIINHLTDFLIKNEIPLENQLLRGGFVLKNQVKFESASTLTQQEDSEYTFCVDILAQIHTHFQYVRDNDDIFIREDKIEDFKSGKLKIWQYEVRKHLAISFAKELIYGTEQKRPSKEEIEDMRNAYAALSFSGKIHEQYLHQK